MNTRSMIIAIVCATIMFGAVGVPKLFAATSPTPSPRTSPTPSPTTDSSQTATSSDTIQQNIKDRIEQVIEEKKATTDQRRKRAIVGQVEKLNAESITIKTLDGRLQIAKILDGKTIMLMLPSLQAQTTQDIELNAFVIAMGYLTEDDVLEVRRLLVSPLPLFPIPRKVFVGTVQNINTKDITVKLRGDSEQKILLSKNTVYQDTEGVKAVRTDFAKDDQVFVSVMTPVTASSSASVIRLLK